MKLRDRVIFSIASILVLMTIVLVLDVETMLTGSRSLLNSKVNVQPARGRHTFIQRHLQKTTNGSRENGSFGAGAKFNSNGLHSLADETNHDKLDNSIHEKQNGKNELPAIGGGALKPQGKSSQTSSTTVAPPVDPFNDLLAVVVKVEQLNERARRKYRHWNPNLGELLGLELG